MRVLGLNAGGRDSGAALVIDGVLVAVAQEDRLVRRRVTGGLPRRSVRACLERAGISAEQLDAVVMAEKPLLTFERTLALQLQAFPKSATNFATSMSHWLGERLWLKSRISEGLGIAPQKVEFVEHQRAHAAAAYFTSPFDDAALLCIDDVGEWATTLLAHGAGDALESLHELHMPHSLGLWLSAFTQYLGFEAGVDEMRVEALAHYGTARFLDQVAATLPEGEDGCFAVDAACFRFSFDDERLFDAELERRLGPARLPSSALRLRDGDSRDADIAASVQRVLELRALALARRLKQVCASDVVCLAGEVARNRGLVARLAAEGPFAHVHVAPAPGDAGAALGAALDYALAAGEVRVRGNGEARIGERLDALVPGAARELGSASAVRARACDGLATGALLAWVQGDLEFGSRSFGARVILADARGADARDRLLGAVQQAETFAACRIAVLAERAHVYFELPDGCEHALRFAHMDVRARATARSAAPSLVAPDGTAWVQLVDAAHDPELHALLLAVGVRSGAPLMALSDFHLRGQPLVRSEADALDAFRRSALDLLFVETRLYERSSG